MRVSIKKAVHLLKQGTVIAVPTETVYGLGASIDRIGAIQQIFTLKGRPSNNPLIIHVASLDQIYDYTDPTNPFPESFATLGNLFWPGPLTLILPIDISRVPAIARAGLHTAGFRIPNHPLALELLKITGPLVMPSANLSGKPSATCLEHVEMDFGKDFPVLDGGKCRQGVESTILYYQEANKKWEIIRQGALPAEIFVSALGYKPKIAENSTSQKPLCPGQLYRHYAPKAHLHLEKNASKCKGVVIGFKERKYPQATRYFELGAEDHPEQAAEQLYAILRELDQQGITEAYVDMDFPMEGLWLTISERLNKAAQR